MEYTKFSQAYNISMAFIVYDRLRKLPLFEENEYKVVQLIKDNRINYACVADYSVDSPLEKIVKKTNKKM